MPKRTTFLAEGEVYHIYNRSTGKINIFTDKRNNKNFLNLIDYYRFPSKLRFSFFNNLPLKLQISYLDQHIRQNPYVEIYAFTLMSTHYHLLIKQLLPEGIKKFIGNIQNSYARFFNIKYDRQGPLFQGMFQARRIETEEEFIHVSRYIHLNPVTSFNVSQEKLEEYPWTSFKYYTKPVNNEFVDIKIIMDHFKDGDEYRNFVLDRSDYQRSLAIIAHLMLD